MRMEGMLVTMGTPPGKRMRGQHRPQGRATYFDIMVRDTTVLARKAWSYEMPTNAFAPIAGFVAFYPHPPLECFVDGERVQPQPGDFYGGWMTSWITGGERGVKGGPGTTGW